MDVPALPDPARRPDETDLPGRDPWLVTPLALIAGGGESTPDRGELRAVPEPMVDDRVVDA